MYMSLKDLFLIRRIKHAFILVTLFFIIFIATVSWKTSSSSSLQKCFMRPNLKGASKIAFLEDVLLSKKKPSLGKSIFFHETTCSPLTHVELTSREACAIESAAVQNPKLDVFVLFASPRLQLNESIPPIIEALYSYKNIYFRNLNLWTYAADTPVYDWLKDGKLFESKYVISHTSDFLRFLTLWKWGGTYLDLDVIVKKSFEKMPANFAGAESERFVAAGIINFDHNGFGHQIADSCLRHFQMSFDGNDWGNNGPGVITRVLQDVCKTKSPVLMNRARCFGFKVYPPEAFYAVRWWNWGHFFDRKHLQQTLKLTNDSIIVHVWNKHSSKKIVSVDSQVAYVKFAQQYCPKVFKSCGGFI